jgi:hypothetical protein
MCPLDVASTDRSTVAVFRVLINVVVENVWPGAAAVSEVRKTRAAPGAGAVKLQTGVPVAEEQVTVSTFSVPNGRPSDSKFAP